VAIAACSVCGVEYVESYEGPCQEFAASATAAQIQAGKPPMCLGMVSRGLTLERRIAVLAGLLSEALNVLEEEPVTAASVVAQGVVEKGRTVLAGRFPTTDAGQEG